MLADARIPSPDADARVLLAHAEATRQSPEALFERRAAREPLAYIVGSVRFRGLELVVDPRVLVPTEERTGTLVEVALELPQGARVHEVGTGCGAVALAIKAERSDLTVSASDISADAVEAACENARRLGLEVPITRADGLPAGDYELVVANLPYTDTDQLTQRLPPEEEHFQPGVALWAGVDSLGLIRRLIRQSPQGTLLALEHAPHHAPTVRALLAHSRTVCDARDDERVTVGRAP